MAEMANVCFHIIEVRAIGRIIGVGGARRAPRPDCGVLHEPRVGHSRQPTSQIHQVIDRDGIVQTSYTYDSTGRVLSQAEAGGTNSLSLLSATTTPTTSLS